MINRKNWWKSNLPTYLIMFLIVVGTILLPYWFTDTSLIWQADGLSQHLPALIHWQKKLTPSLGNWGLAKSMEFSNWFRVRLLSNVCLLYTR